MLCITPEFGSPGTRFGFQTAIYPCRPLAAWRLLRSDQIKPTTRRSETHSRRHINRHFFHRQLSPAAFASEGDCYSSWHSSSDVNYSALQHRVHPDLHPIEWHWKCFADARARRLQPRAHIDIGRVTVSLSSYMRCISSASHPSAFLLAKCEYTFPTTQGPTPSFLFGIFFAFSKAVRAIRQGGTGFRQEPPSK